MKIRAHKIREGTNYASKYGILISGLRKQTSATIRDPKGSSPVKLSILNNCVYTHHIQIECATMCYIKEYILEYTLAEACDMPHCQEIQCKKMYSMNNMKLPVTKYSFCQRKQSELQPVLTEVISIEVHLRDCAYQHVPQVTYCFNDICCQITTKTTTRHRHYVHRQFTTLSVPQKCMLCRNLIVKQAPSKN